MQTAKKIVIIGPAHPLRGGLASFNERLAKEFLTMGHDVSIYTFSLQYPSFLFPGTTQFSSEPAPEGLDIHVEINSMNPLNWYRVGVRLRKLNPDIIVVRYWLPFMGPALGTILRQVKKNKYTRIVCIADNIIPHEKRVGDIPFTKYFIKPVDAFVTMSEKVLKDLTQFKKNKPVALVAHPLYDNFGEKVDKNTARKKLGIAENEQIILFFGFIRKYKGLDILLDAIKILDDKNALPTLKLLVAGEFYESREPYDAQIARLNISSSLYLKTSFIPDSDVKYYLSAADLVVQPYRNATQSGVTPLAYHFEVPMLVTNVGGLPAMVPAGTGLIAEPTASDIAEKIRLYFSASPGRFLPGLKEEKKKYRWNILAEKIIELAMS